MTRSTIKISAANIARPAIFMLFDGFKNFPIGDGSGFAIVRIFDDCSEMELKKVYGHRFSPDDIREMDAVWKVLVKKFFQKWVPREAAILDVGAGACTFINNIVAQTRVAYDANPETSGRCAQEVSFVCGDNLGTATMPCKFDRVFVSNFLEHLDGPDSVLALLSAISDLLEEDGKVLILQPNFALVGAKYFDFIDHKTILTDKSLVEALEIQGFEVEYIKKRFLPYTSKSALPRAGWLVALYLRLPPAQWLLGKQTFIVARKAADHR